VKAVRELRRVRTSEQPRGKPIGVDDMISQFDEKSQQASGYQIQGMKDVFFPPAICIQRRWNPLL